MELRNLSTFVAVTEAGSFTKAAESLGYTQSTVSFQIRQLEEELHCQLFDRISHTIALTTKGQQLLTYALQVLNATETFRENFAAAEKPTGVVRVFSSDSICEKMMLMNYHNFFRTYPEIRLEFQTTDTVTMVEALEHNEADVIFTLDRRVFSRDFVTAREAPVLVHFVVSAEHELAKKEKVEIEDILKHPMLLTEEGMSYRRIMDDTLAQRALQAVPVLETGRTDIIARMLVSGSGVAYLPDFVTEDLVQEGKLIRLDVDGFEQTIWKQLIYHKNKYISGAIKAFIDFVKDHEFEW